MYRGTKSNGKVVKSHALALRKSFNYGSFELNLTSMIDMFTIILLFLLKAYTVTDTNLSPSKDIKLPYSVSKEVPTLEVKVNMSKNIIDVDGRPVVTLRNGLLRSEDVQGLVIFPLFRELKSVAQVKKSEAANDPDKSFKAQIILFGDKKIPYSTLKRVLFTAGQAEYEAFRFSVIRKARE